MVILPKMPAPADFYRYSLSLYRLGFLSAGLFCGILARNLRGVYTSQASNGRCLSTKIPARGPLSHLNPSHGRLCTHKGPTGHCRPFICYSPDHTQFRKSKGCSQNPSKTESTFRFPPGKKNIRLKKSAIFFVFRNSWFLPTIDLKPSHPRLLPYKQTLLPL